MTTATTTTAAATTTRRARRRPTRRRRPARPTRRAARRGRRGRGGALGEAARDDRRLPLDDWVRRRGRVRRRQHKGQYHDESFVDAAGNRWLLYYFLNGDGADNEVCARLSRRSRAALALLSRCSRVALATPRVALLLLLLRRRRRRRPPLAVSDSHAYSNERDPRASPQGHLSLYLSVALPATLPFGWRKHTTFTMSLEHASGDDAQRHAKWATQAFHAVPPPAVQVGQRQLRSARARALPSDENHTSRGGVPFSPS